MRWCQQQASLIQGVALTVKNEINQSQILTVDKKEIRNHHMASKVTCVNNPVYFLIIIENEAECFKFILSCLPD